jgi:hypothetical protein
VGFCKLDTTPTAAEKFEQTNEKYRETNKNGQTLSPGGPLVFVFKRLLPVFRPKDIGNISN